MGTWGVSLSSNDLYADICYEFFELYDEGYSVQDISAKLLAENEEIYETSGDGHNFWFALAKAQWECDALDPAVGAKVREIITSGADITYWREHGASASDLKRRQVVLDKLLMILATTRPKPRARRKKSMVVHHPIYRKGDCLSFLMGNGHYGGIVVLEEVAGTDEQGSYNLIAWTDINLTHKPSLHDFKKSKVLHDTYEDFDPETAESVRVDYVAMFWAMSEQPKDKEDFTELVGTIRMKKTYDVHDYEAHILTGGTFNKSHIERIETLLKQQRDNAFPKASRTRMSKLTGSFL